MMRIKHGMATTPLYKVWSSMKQRTSNFNNKGYKNYGERGINVCDEWQEFMPFMKWSFSNGYVKKLTLDRIKNDEGYSPDNCRWTTMDVQQNNKRTRKNAQLLTFKGETRTILEWSKLTGINYTTLWGRIQCGWATEKILSKKRKTIFVNDQEYTPSELANIIDCSDKYIYRMLKENKIEKLKNKLKEV